MAPSVNENNERSSDEDQEEEERRIGGLLCADVSGIRDRRTM